MEKNNTRDLEDNEEEFYEKAGANRAMTSGSIHMLIAMFSSGCIWIFTMMASGWDGLSYYAPTAALLGLLGLFVNGFSHAFIAKIKEAYVIDPEVGKRKAAGYAKMIWFVAIFSSLVSLMLFIITPVENIFLKWAAFSCIFQMIFGALQTTLGNGLAIINRYDLSSFATATWGPTLLVWGCLWIANGWPPAAFSFYLIFANVIAISVSLYFFHRHVPYSLGDIFKGNFFSEKVRNSVDPELKEFFEPQFSRKFVRYSLFSTVTNLETIGMFANLLVFFATLYLFYFNPGIQEIGLEIIGIVITYSSVKVVILFFSGPLNVELSEAVTKDEHEKVDAIFNNTTRVAALLGLGFGTGMCAVARHILRFLHTKTFEVGGVLDENILLQGQILLILSLIGQFGFGFASLFGAALVGSGNAKYSGIAFGITTGIIIALAPIMIFTTSFVGIGWAQVIANFFLLPYMIWQIRKRLNIRIHFRFMRLLPCITIMFLFMYFYPVNDSISFVVCISLGGFIFLLSAPFFGVSIPEDLEMLEDLFGILKLRLLGKVFGKMLMGIYNISPFNYRERKAKKAAK